MKVLLTGYTGFVGRILLQLLDDKKFEVTKAGRAPDSDYHIDDIAADSNWHPDVLNVDAVVHLAAHVHQMTEVDPSRYFDVNVGGTLQLAKEAANAGVELFIYMSSVKACGESSELGKPLDQQTLCQPSDPYGQSKLEAEQALFQIGKDHDMRIICLRPPLVYGPGVGANFLSLMRLVSSGIPLPLGGLHNKRSFIYVHNLVDCVVQALKAKSTGGSYFVSDDNDLSTSELIAHLSNGFGRKGSLFALPGSLWSIAEKVKFLRAPMQRLLGNLQIDISATKKDLDWIPPVSTEEAIYATVQHYKKSKS